jgi:hypothetical protein
MAFGARTCRSQSGCLPLRIRRSRCDHDRAPGVPQVTAICGHSRVLTVMIVEGAGNTKPQLRPRLLLVRRGGQGRDRTADPPLSGLPTRRRGPRTGRAAARSLSCSPRSIAVGVSAGVMWSPDFFVPKPVPRSPDQRFVCQAPARRGRNGPSVSRTVQGDRHSVGTSPRRASREPVLTGCLLLADADDPGFLCEYDRLDPVA